MHQYITLLCGFRRKFQRRCRGVIDCDTCDERARPTVELASSRAVQGQRARERRFRTRASRLREPCRDARKVHFSAPGAALVCAKQQRQEQLWQAAEVEAGQVHA